MIVRSLRLKNIKSYGEGLDGNGITVHFQAGVNRVAGRNGHGKSTLIEALGYAFFFAEPDFGENFKLPTYFLRSGEKAAEIDVVFEHDGLAYRIERGIGQGKRKSKVIQLSDGSTCAEGDEAVSGWLCRELASEKHRLIPMAELFSNLVGIRQGRLTRPFDTKPADAKAFFDPLLDVGIFRESTLKLNDAQKRFRELLVEQQVHLATIKERIRALQDAVDKLPLKEGRLEALSRTVEKSARQKTEADTFKKTCEQKQTAFNTAKAEVEQANYQLKMAAQKRESDQQQLKDSQEAASTISRVEAGYQAFLQAETQLRALQSRQSQKSALQQQRAEAIKHLTEAQTKKDAAEKQASEFNTQQQRRTKQIDDLRRQLAEETGLLQQSRAEFEHLTREISVTRRSRDTLGAWLPTLARQIDTTKRLLETIGNDAALLGRWSPKELERSRKETERLDQSARALSQRLARAEQAKSTLAAQLAQISGGMCPFLKETCRQFNPQAIQSDLGQREKEILELTAQCQQASAAFEAARKVSEQLTLQETQIAHVRRSFEENVRRFIDHHNELFPVSLREHWQIVHRCAADPLPPAQMLEPVLADSCRNASATGFDSTMLAPLLEAQNQFRSSFSTAFEQASSQLDERFTRFEQQRENRVRREQDVENSKKQLATTEKELKLLEQRIEQLKGEAATAATQVNAETVRIADLDRQLAAFANLDAEFRTQSDLKDRHATDHKAYLGAKPVADKLAERGKLFGQSSDLEARAQEAVRKKAELFDAAQRDFEPSALEKARNDAAAAAARFAIDEKMAQTAERELNDEKERFRQWKESCAGREKIHDEIGRLEAAGQLARLAGKVLKDAAPAVAQHLCSRIAAAAQRIFNQINPEPIELEWKAEPQYSLRISPGDRRFAMLSGGEQTKLALAMTLAMIEQFSGLRFAVFDEPTYGVDAESREKLADAVIELQKAAGLHQLILVSHDNAFDGKIEHVVLLNKTASTGTQLAVSA